MSTPLDATSVATRTRTCCDLNFPRDANQRCKEALQICASHAPTAGGTAKASDACFIHFWEKDLDVGAFQNIVDDDYVMKTACGIEQILERRMHKDGIAIMHEVWKEAYKRISCHGRFDG